MKSVDKQKLINSKKEEVVQGIIFGVVLVLIVTLIIIINDKEYYFPKEKSTIIGELQIEQPKQNEYKTIIVADNTYTGVKINEKKDAIKLIEEDSIKQKTTCSKEIIDIENKIIKDFNITAVNLCEMDTSLANELYNVLYKIYKEYPSVKGYMTNISLRNSTIENEKVIAAFTPTFEFATSNTISTYPWVYKTEILLNSNYFLNRDRLQSTVNDASFTGHFPPNATIYSPVAHEFGHYLSFLALLKEFNKKDILLVEKTDYDKMIKISYDYSKGIFSKKILDEAFKKYQKDNRNIINFNSWKRTISAYANAKDQSGNYIYDETIAEAFHDVYLNGNNAKPASKYIVEVLKEKLKG